MVLRGRSRSNSLEAVSSAPDVPKSPRNVTCAGGGGTVVAACHGENPKDLLGQQNQLSHIPKSPSLSREATVTAATPCEPVTSPTPATAPILPASPGSLLLTPTSAGTSIGLTSPQHLQQQADCAIINPPVMSREPNFPIGKSEFRPPTPLSSTSRIVLPPSWQPPSHPQSKNQQHPAVVVASVLELLQGACTIPRDAFTCHSSSTTARDLLGDYYSIFNEGFHRRYGDLGANSADEEEEMQMRRLGSWSTQETLGTSASDMTLDAWMTRHNNTPNGTQVDDDGHVIDPVLIEKRLAVAREKHLSRKSKRVVKFEYPPVSSLRQCPRHDPEDLPELFFTEEELEVFENDRESTFTADDIEIVAISSRSTDSGEDRQQPQTRQSKILEPTSKESMHRNSAVGGGFGGLGNYIATPRKWSKKRIGHPSGSLYRDDPSSVYRKQSSTASADLGTVERKTKNGHKQERLIKSVQIFLRERSVG